MLNWLLRYQPVIRVLEKEPGVPSVLDVGSGWFGLSWYWPHPVVQTDLLFPPPAPSQPRPGRAAFVRSSAERLPFADNTFDVVVSLDMLEHLPDAIRVESLRELTRVARQLVLLAFPQGETAARVDRNLARALRLIPRRNVPPWLAEHVAQERYPDEQLVSGSLPKGWVIESRLDVGNAPLQGMIVLAEELPLFHRVTALAERRWRTRPAPGFLNRGRPYRHLYLLRSQGLPHG